MKSLFSQSWGTRCLAAVIGDVGRHPGSDSEAEALLPAVTAAPPGISPAVVERIQASYPKLALGVQIIRNGLGNIGRGCLLGSGSGRYFLKRFDPVMRSAEAIHEEHQVVRYLVAARFPTPNVLDNAVCDTITWADGWPYALYEVARGGDCYADATVFAPFERPEHAVQAGRTLARFHKTLEHFPDPPQKPFYGLTAQYKLLGENLLREGLLELLSGWPILREFVAAQPELSLVLELLEPYQQELSGLYSRLPCSVIHGDFIKRNLFFEGDEVTAVIDFDLCNLAPRLYDVCLSLQPICFPWDRLLGGRGELNERDASAFLDGYMAVYPLKSAELAALPAVLATCRFEFYLGLAGLELARGDGESARRWFEFQVDVLRWFSSHPRATRFLAGE